MTKSRLGRMLLSSRGAGTKRLQCKTGDSVLLKCPRMPGQLIFCLTCCHLPLANQRTTRILCIDGRWAHFGPAHCTGLHRCENTGSVRNVMPSILTSTLACPIQTAVMKLPVGHIYFDMVQLASCQSPCLAYAYHRQLQSHLLHH